MTKFLLAVHVLAAIVAIGPVTVAASMFPPAARRALAAPDDARAGETVRLLHRICQVYAAVGLAVPVFGFATAGAMGVMGDPWLITSIVLTVLAAGVLLVLVLPGQEVLVEGAGAGAGAGKSAGAGAEASRNADPETGTATGSSTGADTSTSAGATTSADATTGTGTGTREATVRLAMFTGIFNLLWATVTILMIVRPGSTTGA
ncbi:hypothetical protein [Streptomyces maremycinicus]|uniref:hypothetical protein n=1 Tax=Streptomyces maremycinicus TaxID=1679753 RepID=UPI000786E5AE|nr:hypothetical protein [Streptomyces sp. NBRC 110468]